MAKKKQKSNTWIWMVAVLCVLALAAAVAMLWRPSNASIDSFEECKAAGGAIVESYPEQCALNGKSFTNDAQSNDNTNEYVGLGEQAALDKAKAANKAARVVERDGKSLPVDASFQPGRLNLTVKDGKVASAQIEGEDL